MSRNSMSENDVAEQISTDEVRQAFGLSKLSTFTSTMKQEYYRASGKFSDYSEYTEELLEEKREER